MPWFIVDDKWHSHPKVVGLSLAAAGLWAKAGSWCGDHLTDGAVPRSLPRAYDATPETVQELVDSGLWEETESGWQFHDWHKRYPSRASVLAKRKADAERKARGRSSPKRRRKVSERNPSGLHPESSGPIPIPSPIPKESESARGPENDQTTLDNAEPPFVRLGKLYQQLYDAELEGLRNPRPYNQDRITSTDAKHFIKLVDLVRAESARTHAGERAVFTAAAQMFLRDSTQRTKGLVLAYFVGDFERYVDRSGIVESAS